MVLVLAGCADGDGEAATAPSSAGAATSSGPTDNGVVWLDTEQIVERAVQALDNVASYRVKGIVYPEDGEQITFEFQVRGEEYLCRISQGDVEYEILVVGGESYARGNRAFWNMADADKGDVITGIAGDNWLAGVDELADEWAPGFLAEDNFGLYGELSRHQDKSMVDAHVIGISDASDPPQWLYVSTIGEPYPMRLTDASGAGLVFAEFGEAFPDIAKPDQHDILIPTQVPSPRETA